MDDLPGLTFPFNPFEGRDALTETGTDIFRKNTEFSNSLVASAQAYYCVSVAAGATAFAAACVAARSRSMMKIQPSHA